MKAILLAALAAFLGAARADPVAPTIELVDVPGGCFAMGAADGEKVERPVHRVCVDSFRIGKYEVTQAQWRAAMGSNPAVFQDCGGDCPVENVSWDETQQFLKQLNDENAGVFRLPTEAEWEYACRGAGGAEEYTGGVPGSRVGQVAWFNRQDGVEGPRAVGKKPANTLGIHDMAGNVWEWVQDTFLPYASAEQNNPRMEAETRRGRVIRGGGWDVVRARYLRCATRKGYVSSRGDKRFGFRVVQELQK